MIAQLYVLFQSHGSVTAFVKIVLVHLTAVVFVDVPTMKHPVYNTAFVFLHALHTSMSNQSMKVERTSSRL